ncbi:MAG TPA: TetR family transcriptional regulator [Marmoricola sp.]|nr:TetR family transcriptional regulator [Marmoricola sp.]
MSDDPRARLVAGAVELLGREGIGDRSLRSLAESLGTSHRMLLYHFGSREGLLAAVTSAVEERQRHVMAVTYDEDRPPLEAAAEYWEQVVSETLRYGPLFFELAAHAMQGRPHAASLRTELIGAWLPPLVELVGRLGVPEEEAEAHARLALGAARGLLLDLLVSGDRDGVAEAAALLNRLLLASVRSDVQPPG